MGGATSFKPFNVTCPFFFITITTTTLILIIVADANDNSRDTLPSLENDNDGGAPPSGHIKTKSERFKPGTAMVVGTLTTIFSLTFLLLLYLKHCNGGHTFAADNNRNRLSIRKNSGIDRAVVELLPMFRFGSLRGQKEGLDCAVCLTRFEDLEVLRLLPKCKHAFHVECVDTWLKAHSTCPLCRYKVDPKDIVHEEDPKALQQSQPPIPQPPRNQEKNNEEEEPIDIESGRNNDSNNLGFRHSSGGEKDGGFLEIVLHDKPTTSSFSRKTRSKSVGGFVRSRKDDMSLTQDTKRSTEHRLEHCIIVSPSSFDSVGSHQQRWRNVQPSDLLYLTYEMIINDDSISREQQNMQVRLHKSMHEGRRTINSRSIGGETENNGGGGVLNLRSFSEITGMSRFLSGGNKNRGRAGQGGHEGVVSRWSAWISKA